MKTLSTPRPHLLAALLIAGLAGLASAGPAAALSVAAKLGLGGYTRHHLPVPLELAIRNDSADPFNGWAEIHPAGMPAQRRRVLIPPESDKKVCFLVLLSDATYQVGLKLFDAGGRERFAEDLSIESSKVVGDAAALVLVLDRFGSGLKLLEEGSSDKVVSGGEELIPDHEFGLAAATAVLVGDLDPGALSDRQAKALRNYAANGGRLLFFPSGDAALIKSELFADYFPHAGTTPGQADQLALSMPDPRDPTLWRDLPIERAGGIARLVLDGVTGPGLADPQGAFTQSPDALFRRLGRGTVGYLTFSPLDRHLQSSRPFVAYLRDFIGTGTPFTHEPLQAIDESRLMPDSVGRPDPAPFFILLFLYIAAVGPVNYLFLAARKRKQLLAVTIPAISLGAGLIIFGVVELGRTAQSLLRQVDLVYVADAEAGGGPSYYTGIYSHFSAGGGRLDFDLAPGAVVAPFSYTTYSRNQYAEMLGDAVAETAEAGATFGPVGVDRFSCAIFDYAGFTEAGSIPVALGPLRLVYRNGRPEPDPGIRDDRSSPPDRNRKAAPELAEVAGTLRLPTGEKPQRLWLIDAAGSHPLQFKESAGDGAFRVRLADGYNGKLSDFSNSIVGEIDGPLCQFAGSRPLVVAAYDRPAIRLASRGGSPPESATFYILTPALEGGKDKVKGL